MKKRVIFFSMVLFGSLMNFFLGIMWLHRTRYSSVRLWPANSTAMPRESLGEKGSSYLYSSTIPTMQQLTPPLTAHSQLPHPLPGSVSMSNATLIAGYLNGFVFDIAMYLSTRQHEVVTLEDIISPSFDVTKDRQTAKDSFAEKKLSYESVDLSNMKKVCGIVKDKRFETIVYSLPLSLRNETTDKVNGGIETVGKLIYHFIAFLESVKLDRTRVILVSNSPSSPIQRTLVELFRLLLNSYQSTRSDIEVFVGLVEEGFNTIECSNFEDFIHYMYGARGGMPPMMKQWSLQCQRKYMYSTDNRLVFTGSRYLKKHNVIFTTYFTNGKKFVREYRENSFQFVKGFMVTAKKYNAHVVMFYDQIDPLYKERLLQFYGNIEFVRYTGDFHNRSINDGRFYIIYKYLQDHPEIDRMLLQDLRDGIYLNDPFKVMELTGDYLFVGKDLAFWTEFIERHYLRCETELHERYHDSPRYFPMLNAGTVAGSRHVMLEYLKQLIKAFEEVYPSKHNCNMDAVDFVAHYFFKDILFTGYPFQGFLNCGLASPSGIAVRHKRTKFDM